MKKKVMIGEGVLAAKPPQKPEHFDARKGNGNHICDFPYGFINEILTPHPPFGVEFIS